MRVGMSQQPFRRGHGRKVNVDTRKIISKEELKKQPVSLVRGGRGPGVIQKPRKSNFRARRKDSVIQQEMKTFALLLPTNNQSPIPVILILPCLDLYLRFR